MFEGGGASKTRKTLLRGAGALVVAYLFIIVILVATAQQRVAEALDSQKVGYDYNVAIRYHFEPEQLGTKRGENLKELIEANAALRDVEQKITRNERNLARQIAILRGTLSPIAESGCQLPAVTDDPDSLIASVPIAQECLTARGADATPAMARTVAAAVQGAEQADAMIDLLAAQKGRKAHLEDHIRSLDETQTAIKTQMESVAKSQNIMAVLDLFRTKCVWEFTCWPGSGLLVHVPPTLMAIFVSFASGMFGALLITLVLYVYPDNNLKFTQSHAFAGRILLGGLIALGVFVLLFSGVAVLGGSDNASEGSHNVMAYAAIGILCGMFSDQAAAWLSGQAATLLKQQQQQQQQQEDEGDPADAAPPATPPPPAG